MVRPKQISDRDLLRAAREAFLRDGPRTAVTQIAERLGVSAAALFQRAGSKAQLMLMALLPGVPPALQAFSQEPARDRTVSAQLHAHLAELMTFLQAVVPSLLVLRASGLFPPQRGKKRSKAGPSDGFDPETPSPVVLRERLGAWLAQAKQQGRIEVLEPHVCAEALLGAMEARCFNAHVGGEDYVRGTDDAFLSGLIAGLLVDKELEGNATRARKKR